MVITRSKAMQIRNQAGTFPVSTLVQRIYNKKYVTYSARKGETQMTVVEFETGLILILSPDYQEKPRKKGRNSLKIWWFFLAKVFK